MWRVEMNPSRFHLTRFVERAAQSLNPGALVLDVGAGDAPYRSLFSDVTYESLDFCKVDKEYAEQTYIGDATAIPVEDERFDMVLMTQVMEHLPDPMAVLCEIHRVMKPHATFWVSCPLFYQEHEQPYDFFRYTQFGLQHLFERAGFRIDEIEWLEGYAASAAYQLHFAARELPRGPKAYGGGLLGTLTGALVGLQRPLFTVTAYALNRADIRSKWTASGMCKNYALVASKAL
jgi:SAM-dependent methyltransferase